MTRVLALDVGDRWIGLALSDPGGTLATPLSVFKRHGDSSDVSTISKVIDGYGVSLVLIGLPRLLSGELGLQAEKTQQFSGMLSAALKVPVELRDERLTTAEAKRLLQEGSRPRRHLRDDAAAAAVILQDFLDEKRPPQPSA